MSCPPAKLLLIGPVPPPLGGATVLFQFLLDELSLREDIEVVVVNTTATGCGQLGKIYLLLGQFLKVLWFLPQVNIVSLHASTRRFILFGGLLRVLCRVCRRPFIARLFGGSLLEAIKQLSGLKRWCFKSVMKADFVLVEIKEMREWLSEQFPDSKLLWFANSRPYDRGSVTCLPSIQSVEGRLVFSFISHVRPEKGIYELARAVRLLGARQDFEVRVYGPLFPEVDLSMLKISDKISYRGSLDPDEVSAVIHASDVVLLPSWYDGEGHPGTLIEAFVLGRPVIATRWKYIPEVVEDSVNGLLVDPKDSASLANAMRRILNDRSLLKVLADGARQSASHFSSAYWNGNVFCGLCFEVSKSKEQSEQ